ncbi:MBL fold metallo-hydrolase [Candidatus Acetothermia bacterium]|nr:MBL fold metallo-hydrolase [Candidatus Acetothermia bacterium]
MKIFEATPVPHLYLQDVFMIGLEKYGCLYVFKTPKPAIIETGFSTTVSQTLEGLRELGIRPEDVAYICPTHVHMDHAGGTSALAEACPNAKVICHHLGAPHLIDPTKLIESVKRAVGPLFPYYGEMKPVPAERFIQVKGGEIFDLGDGYKLEMIDAPGHAPHQACFYEHKTRGLFTADAVGIYRKDSTGFMLTTPPPAFHFEQSLETLDRFKRMRLDWLYFTHFGVHAEPYKLIDEYRKVLTEWVAEVEHKKRELKDDMLVKEFFVQKETPFLKDFYEPIMIRSEVEMNVQGVLLYLKKVRGLV